MELRKQQVASWSVDIPEEEEQGQRQRRQGSQDSPLQLMDLSDETDGEGSGLSRSQSPSQSQSPTLSGSQTPVGRPPPYFGDLSSSSGGESTPPSPLLNHRVAGMIRSEFSKSAGALCDQLRGGDSSNRGGSSGAGTGTSEKAKPTMVRKMRSHAWQNAGFRIDDDASEGYGDIDDSSASVHVPIEPRSLADLMNGKKNAFEREESAVPFVREKFEKFGAKANVDTTAARRGGGVGGDGEPTPLASGGQWEQKVSKTDAQPLARSVSRSDTEPAASFEQGKQASIFHSPPPAFQSDAEIVGVDSDATIPARGGRKKQISKCVSAANATCLCLGAATICLLCVAWHLLERLMPILLYRHNHRKGDPKQTRCKARCCPKRPSVGGCAHQRPPFLVHFEPRLFLMLSLGCLKVIAGLLRPGYEPYESLLYVPTSVTWVRSEALPAWFDPLGASLLNPSQMAVQRWTLTHVRCVAIWAGTCCSERYFTFLLRGRTSLNTLEDGKPTLTPPWLRFAFIVSFVLAARYRLAIFFAPGTMGIDHLSVASMSAGNCPAAVGQHHANGL